jgi:hypothetical protein
MRHRLISVAACAALLPAGTAFGGTIVELGFGWEAIVPENTTLLVNFGDTELRLLVLEKFSEFNVTQPVSITFIQNDLDVNTATRIVITAAEIVNLTGETWVEFHETLTGDAVMFNQEVTENSGFTFDPFTTASYNPNGHEVVFTGGRLNSGDTWLPGLDAGGLVIDVELSGADVSFILEQMPIIPTPGSMALLAMGGALLIPQRRRR